MSLVFWDEFGLDEFEIGLVDPGMNLLLDESTFGRVDPWMSFAVDEFAFG